MLINGYATGFPEHNSVILKEPDCVFMQAMVAGPGKEGWGVQGWEVVAV